MNKLGSGQLQYLAGVLVVLVLGILFLLWTRLGLDPEFILHGDRKARMAVGIACVVFALVAVIVLLFNWDRVSSMGRIHFH